MCTIIGSVVLDGNRKRFKAKSADFLQTCINRHNVGTELAAMRPTRERRTRGPQLFGHIVGTRPSIRFSSPDMQAPLSSGFSREGRRQSNPRAVAVTVVR